MVDSSAVKAYLVGISDRYDQWRRENALTDTIAEGQATFAPFEKFVQTEEQRRGERPEKITLPLLKGIGDYVDKEHVLLVGSPGVGKSSALWHCLNDLAEKELQATEPRIPVLIELKGYRDNLTSPEDPSGLLALIRASIKRHIRISIPEIENLLYDGQLILLLDGLNEIPAGAFRTHLKTLLQECQDSKVPLICSTRELYGGDLGIQRKLEIQPLNPGEVERFLRECLPEHQNQVRQLLQRDNRDLSRTPFVLWMLYHLLKETGTIADTLAEAFHVFLHTDLRRYKEDISTERRENWNLWLGQLAFSMLNNPDPLDPGLVISRESAEKILAENFAYEPSSKYFRIDELLSYSPLINKASDKDICFQHQLVQECYAAEFLLDKIRKEPQLFHQQLNKEYAIFQIQYLNHPKWTEAILLMLGFPEARSITKQVVEAAMDIDLVLGARTIGETHTDLREDLANTFLEDIENEGLSASFKAKLLSNTRSVSASRKLLKCLRGEQEQEKIFEIAFALRENGDKTISEELLGIAESNENDITTLAAIYALGKLGDESASNRLQMLYENSTCSIREQLLQAVGEIDPREAISLAYRALDDASAVVREKAIEILESHRDESSFDKLIVLALDDKSFSNRWIAAEAIGRINPKQAAEKLSAILRTSENIETKVNVVQALGKIGGELAIEILVDEIDDIYINDAIVEALIEIGSIKAVPRLLEALQQEHGFTAQIACVLGELQDPLAVPYLIDLLNHWNMSVQEEAVEALGKLGDKTAILKLDKLLRQNTTNDFLSKEFCRKIFIALGKLGDERVRPRLIDLLKEQAFGSCLYRSDSWQFFEALEIVSDDSVVEALVASLKSKNCQVRYMAAETLGTIGDDSTIESLVDLLEDEDSTVCWKASKALGKLDAQQVLQKLSLILKYPSRDVRCYVAQALGFLEDKSAVEMLFQMLDDPEEAVRCDAVQGLAKLSKTELKLDASKILSFSRKRKFQNDDLFYPLSNIQSNCGFYDYDFYVQGLKLKGSHLSEAEILSRVDQNTQKIREEISKMESKPRNEFNNVNFNAPVNFGDNPTGNFTSTQNNYVNDPEVQGAISDLEILFSQLQVQYPSVNTESEALAIIDAEFTDIQQSQSHKLSTLRKQLLNPERHLQASKAAAIEVAKHYLEDSVLAKALITYFDKLSEEPSSGA